MAFKSLVFGTLALTLVPAAAAAQSTASAQGRCNAAFANSPIRGSVTVLCGTNPREMLAIRDHLARLERQGLNNAEALERIDRILNQIVQPQIARNPELIASIASQATAAPDPGASAETILSSFEDFVDDQFYDINRLPPRLRELIARARNARRRARQNAAIAEAVASRARRAADRALVNAPGMLNVTEGARTYRGEAPFGRSDAVGIAYIPDGTRYEGSFLSDFTITGYGIQYTRTGFQMFGKFVAAQADEVAVITSFDGLRYEGEFTGGRNQAGVGIVPGGGRYEGEMSGFLDGTGTMRRNGLGAEWMANGTLLNAGVYVDDRLVEPIPLSSQ